LRKYGAYAVAAVVVILLSTAAYVGYEYWRTHRAGTSGDDFARAMALSDEGRNDEALAALRAVVADGHASYPALAHMGIATVLARMDDVAGAVSEFDAVATQGSIPEVIRNMARLRA